MLVKAEKAIKAEKILGEMFSRIDTLCLFCCFPMSKFVKI